MPSALRIKEIRDLEDNVMMSNGALTSNVDMSNVSFPAGHVIQLKHERYIGTDLATNNQNWVELSSSLRLSFALNSTNKVLVNVSGGGPNKHGGSNSNMSYYSWGLLNSDGSITNFSDSSQGLAFFGSEITYSAHPCSLSYSYVYTPADWSIGDYSNPFTLTPIYRSGDGGTVRATEGGGNQNIQVYGMVFQQ